MITTPPCICSEYNLHSETLNIYRIVWYLDSGIYSAQGMSCLQTSLTTLSEKLQHYLVTFLKVSFLQSS